MFEFRREAEKMVNFTVDGRPCRAPRGSTVATALLTSGIVACRKTESKAPRAPYCLVGQCFDCLVEINGIGNRQACMEPIDEGMAICRQNWRRE
jgi:D-hydroxyproline dehydrogenase subunit gamma